MKTEIINTLPPNKIGVDSLKESELSRLYYGIDHGGKRGFIAREKYDAGDYVARCPNAITKGNAWSWYNSDTIKGCIENCLSEQAAVYQFDTSKELFAWLAGEAIKKAKELDQQVCFEFNGVDLTVYPQSYAGDIASLYFAQRPHLR